MLNNPKRLIIALIFALQIPFAYFLSGHDLFKRADGLGAIYLSTIFTFGLAYFYLKILKM
jgi:hypothetical protein